MKDTKVRWKAIVYAGKDVQGRQRQRTRTGHASNLQAARKAEEAARVQLRAELAAEAVWKGTVREMLDEWISFKRPSNAATTHYSVEVMAKRIRRDLGPIRLNKLTARDLDRFYTGLIDGGLSASTANHYHRIIHAMLEQAYRWDKVPGNVADKASPPRKRRNAHDHVMPTPEALRVLIGSAPPSLRVAAALAAATGCRRGEIVGLLWSDIDGDQLTVRRALVRVPGQALASKDPKSGVARTITLDGGIIVVLAAHRARLAETAVKLGGLLADDGPIFAKLTIDNTGRTPYPPGWVTQEWRRLCRKNGVTFRFHDIRHFHATQLIGSGVDLAAVSGRLGHSKISTTSDVYTHALKASDDHAARAIGEIMRPKESSEPS